MAGTNDFISLAGDVPSANKEEQKVNFGMNKPAPKKPEPKPQVMPQAKPEVKERPSLSSDNEGIVEVKKQEAKEVKQTTKKSATKKKKKASPDDVAMRYIRDVPASLVAEIRRCFPNCNNQTDAVVAYLAIKCNDFSALNDAQLDLVRNYKGVDPLIEIDKRLQTLERNMFTTVRMLEEFEVVLSYLVFDRLGFRKENPPRPSAVVLDEKGMLEILDTLRSEARSMVDYEKDKKGRPIR